MRGMAGEFGATGTEERWNFTESTAVLLAHGKHRRGLILVQNDGLWGPPAGGIRQGEYMIDGLRREILEETQIGPGNVYFHGPPNNWAFRPSDGYLAQLSPTITITIPQGIRTQKGEVYQAEYVGPKLPKDGWKIKGDKKVGYCKPFSPSEILKLLSDHYSSRPTIYKPQFSAVALIHHILTSTSQGGNFGKVSGYPKNVNQTLERIWVKTGFLAQIEDGSMLFGGENENLYWTFYHPSIGGAQNREAVARKQGYKSGI